MTGLVYRTFDPPAALAPYVECFWTLRGAPEKASFASENTERILPDGRVEIVLNLAAPVWQGGPGEPRVQPTDILVGPTSKAVLIQPHGVVHMIAVRFRHGGARLAVDVPLAELTDQIVALSDVARLFDSSIRDQLLDAENEAGAVAVLEEALLARARRRTSPPPPAIQAARLILRARGALDVSRVAWEFGVSTRHLARRFQADVGVGPKVLARLSRFHLLLRVVNFERPRTLAGAAAAAGYVDQAHLARDFREFAGQSASEYFRGTNALTGMFLDLDQLPGSSAA